MKDYNDRIGEPVRGTDGEGLTVYGIYHGLYNGIYTITSHEINDSKHFLYAKEIEFLLPSVFRHYGKRAEVWHGNNKKDSEIKIIVFTSKNGGCMTIRDNCTIEQHEYSPFITRYFDHYKLIEPTKTLTIDGKDYEVTEEQKRKVLEVVE